MLLEVVEANCRTPRHRLETELIREEGDELAVRELSGCK
jgi:hypothetical protein